MTKVKYKTLTILTLSQLMVIGCANQNTNDILKGAGLGAIGGAALGCGAGFLIGGNSKDCVKGAVAGAVTGAAAGWATVKYQQYQAEQVRTTKEDQRVYGLAKSVDSPQVKINKGLSQPNMIRPGDSVKLITDYSIRLPKKLKSVAVSESWTLKKDGEVLAALPEQTSQRGSGGWSIDAAVPIPQNASAGTYVIEHKIKSDNSYDIAESTFIVAN